MQSQCDRIRSRSGSTPGCPLPDPERFPPAIQHGVECRARRRPRGARGVGRRAFLPVFAHALFWKGQLCTSTKFILHRLHIAMCASDLLGNGFQCSILKRQERNLHGPSDVAAFKPLCGKGAGCEVIPWRFAFSTSGRSPSPVLAVDPSPRTLWRRHRPGLVGRHSAGNPAKPCPESP